MTSEEASQEEDKGDVIEKLEEAIAKEREREPSEIIEDPYTRIAYIIEKEGGMGEFERELATVMAKRPNQIIEEKYVQFLRNRPSPSPLSNSNERPGNSREQSVEVFPFYLPSIRSINTINVIKIILEPVDWIVYSCDSREDLLYAIELTRLGDAESYRELLNNYNLETVLNYAVVKIVDRIASSFVSKIESSREN